MTSPTRKRLLELAGIKPVFDLALLLYYRRALREIHPLHPDVPRIVHRIHSLESAA